jgi:hypothetical protein
VRRNRVALFTGTERLSLLELGIVGGAKGLAAGVDSGLGLGRSMKALILKGLLAIWVWAAGGDAWAISDNTGTAMPPVAAGVGQVPAGAAFAAKEGTGMPRSGTELAKTISQITGVAISPLLGTSTVGAWRYFETPKGKRGALPWFAQPWFWLPALILVGLVFAKDALGPATPTALKKPIDVAEVIENKISGLIAAGAFVPLAVGIFGSELPGTTGVGWDPAAAGLAAATGSQFVNLLLTPFAIIAFVAVWLLGHVFNVLILLSPFTTVDTVLKLARTALLASVVGTSFASPWIGAIWALAIVLVGLVLSGWSFRLTLLGGVFIFDVLSRRRRWFRPDPKSNWMFLAREVGDAPVRSYGKLTRDDSGTLRFNYRNYLLGQEREVALPSGEYSVGRGFIYADLLKIEGEETRRLGILPPRYKRHEEEITRLYGFAEPRDVGIRAVFRVLGDLLGFGGGSASPSRGRAGTSSAAG